MTRPLKARLDQGVDAAYRIEIIEQELFPPEPRLLDTCVLQNLDWVDRRIESGGPTTWDDEAVADLTERYGAELANDLIDVGILYKELEDRSGYPWLVSRTSQGEASLADGVKGVRLLSLLGFFRGHQDDWSDEAYSGIEKGAIVRSSTHSRVAAAAPWVTRDVCGRDSFGNRSVVIPSG